VRARADHRCGVVSPRAALTQCLLVAAALSLASGCAKRDWIDRTLVTGDVTGTWQTDDARLQLNLKQQGARAMGLMLRLGAFGLNRVSGGIEGTVAGDVFRWKQTSGVSMNCEGEMTVSEDAMRGVVYCNQLGRQLIDLKRVNSSPPSSS